MMYLKIIIKLIRKISGIVHSQGKKISSNNKKYYKMKQKRILHYFKNAINLKRKIINGMMDGEIRKKNLKMK